MERGLGMDVYPLSSCPALPQLAIWQSMQWPAIVKASLVSSTLPSCVHAAIVQLSMSSKHCMACIIAFLEKGCDLRSKHMNGSISALYVIIAVVSDQDCCKQPMGMALMVKLSLPLSLLFPACVCLHRCGWQTCC